MTNTLASWPICQRCNQYASATPFPHVPFLLSFCVCTCQQTWALLIQCICHHWIWTKLHQCTWASLFGVSLNWDVRETNTFLGSFQGPKDLFKTFLFPASILIYLVYIDCTRASRPTQKTSSFITSNQEMEPFFKLPFVELGNTRVVWHANELQRSWSSFQGKLCNRAPLKG